MMNQNDLRKLQLTELEILKEIHRICEKNKIQYWLTGGTLIGAIRHTGFIPWDDDVDIAMLRDDYNKFMQVASSALSDQFYLQNWHTDKKFGQSYSKIRKNNTILLEAGSEKVEIHHGIFIDIFVYDKYPDNKIDFMKVKFSMQVILRTIIVKCGFTPWKGVDKVSLYWWLYFIPFRFLAKFLKLNKMKDMHEKLVQVANSTGSKFIFNSCESDDEKHPIPYEYVSVILKHKFENQEFYIPAGYDKILRIFYGNYMLLPPKEQREGHHNIVRLKF